VSSGLQGERTELAWLRTALASWAAALITTRAAFPLGAIALLASITVTVVAGVRRRRLKDPGAPPALSYKAALALTCACTLIALTVVLL
jgi:hypothetical protein